MFTLIKNNVSFKYLYLGAMISTIGDYLYDIAITLLVFDITKSINAIAFMWLSKGVLRVLVQYWSGQISDKFNRKHILVIVNLLSIIPALMFMFINKHNIVLAYLGVFLLQSLNDIDTCGEISILPELVKQQDLVQANSLFSATNTIIMFLTLGISGVIYKALGANILFIINALSFLISGILFSFINYKFERKQLSKSNLKSIIDIKGFSVIKENKKLKTVIFISSIFAILSRIYDVYNIFIADSILNIGSEGIIYFRYSIAIGSLIAPVIINKCTIKDDLKKYLYISILNSIVFIFLPLNSNLYISLLFFAVFGLTISLQGILLTTILQKNTAKESIGRVFSSYKILITIISLITVTLITFINNKVNIKYVFGIIGGSIMLICLLCSINIKLKKNNKETLGD